MKPAHSRHRLLWGTGLLALAAALIALPLVLYPAHSFGGADDRAAELIASMGSPEQPWFRPMWQPGSEDTRTALFAVQAVLGLALTVAFLAAMRRRRGG